MVLLNNAKARWFPLIAECAMILCALVTAFLVVPWLATLGEAEVAREAVGDVAIAAKVHFDGSMITLTNGNFFDWTNIELCINYGLPKTYRATIPWIRPGASYVVDIREFVRRYGVRFDPFRTQILQFSIWCDTYHGTGVWDEPWQ